MTTRERLVDLVARAQRIPYAWPMDPGADATRAAGRGTCAGKHAVLAEDLVAAGFDCSRLMVVGPLAPAVWPDLVARADGLLEVHECLTVETPWSGPLLVDVTWHPDAVALGLPGTLDWDGTADMRCAVDPVASYAVADGRFREQKELLRARLYSPDRRRLRDEILAEIAARAGGSAVSARRQLSSPASPRNADRLP